MKRINVKTGLAAVALLLAAPLARVSAGERVYLWPEGKMPDAQKHQIAAMTDESTKKDFDRASHLQPYIEWFDPPAETNRVGACMILISGGSYNNCCDTGLIKAWNRDLTKLGIQCVNLVYRTPRPQGIALYQTAWEDGQRAVRLVRRDAEKRGFGPERIGAMSMSAGSHLNTLLATSSQTPAYARIDEVDDTPCHLNWACANAIAFGMTDGLAGRNARSGMAVDARLDGCFKFDAKTCPMWMSHGGVDVYSPNTSLEVYRRLHAMKVPAELHLYPDCNHGAHGFPRAVEFLRQIGVFGPLQPEEKLLDRYASDDDRAEVVREELWPVRTLKNGQKVDLMPDPQTNVTVRPYLEWHFPKTLKTRAIQVIWSGGGYGCNSPANFEVTPLRRLLNAKGMTVVTVLYRSPRPLAESGLAKHTLAWQDVQRAIRMIRSEAPARGLDPDRIGIMGSSAGGHLALMGATSSTNQSYLPVDELDRKVSCEVAWAVAVYPAYVLADGDNGPNARLGVTAADGIVDDFAFDLKTCPTLFLHGDSDGYSSMGSVKCWERMRRMGIQGELHTLANRNHAFHYKSEPDTGAYTVLERVWDFLRAKKFVRSNEFFSFH